MRTFSPLARDRFMTYLESFSQDGPNILTSRYPGLSTQPFHSPNAFPISQQLENSYDIIRSEIEALNNISFHPEIEGVRRIGSWEVFQLFERGRKRLENCKCCPQLTAIIETHETVRTIAGLTYISRMKAGTQIAAHCGPTNIRLRCHLGISVPSGNCALRVGNETRKWHEGKCLVFDDSLEHESWNHGTGERTVLILDIWHPDLTREEVTLLKGLHNYTSAHAEGLIRYWAASDKARDAKRSLYD